MCPNSGQASQPLLRHRSRQAKGSRISAAWSASRRAPLVLALGLVAGPFNSNSPRPATRRAFSETGGSSRTIDEQTDRQAVSPRRERGSLAGTKPLGPSRAGGRPTPHSPATSGSFSEPAFPARSCVNASFSVVRRARPARAPASPNFALMRDHVNALPDGVPASAIAPRIPRAAAGVPAARLFSTGAFETPARPAGTCICPCCRALRRFICRSVKSLGPPRRAPPGTGPWQGPVRPQSAPRGKARCTFCVMCRKRAQQVACQRCAQAQSRARQRDSAGAGCGVPDESIEMHQVDPSPTKTVEEQPRQRSRPPKGLARGIGHVGHVRGRGIRGRASGRGSAHGLSIMGAAPAARNDLCRARHRRAIYPGQNSGPSATRGGPR